MQLTDLLRRAGVPALLLVDVADLPKMAAHLGYDYKIRPILLPLAIGWRRWLREMAQGAEAWIDC